MFAIAVSEATFGRCEEAPVNVDGYPTYTGGGALNLLAERCCKRAVVDISCVADMRGLENQSLRLVVGTCPVFRASRDYEQFTGPEFDNSVAKFDAHAPAPDQEQLVFILVPMPGKGPQKLHELDLLPVQLGYDFGPPMFLEKDELLFKSHFFHLAALRETHRRFYAKNLRRTNVPGVARLAFGRAAA